jgi:hypothetical protein
MVKCSLMGKIIINFRSLWGLIYSVVQQGQVVSHRTMAFIFPIHVSKGQITILQDPIKKIIEDYPANCFLQGNWTKWFWSSLSNFKIGKKFSCPINSIENMNIVFFIVTECPFPPSVPCGIIISVKFFGCLYL